MDPAQSLSAITDFISVSHHLCDFLKQKQVHHQDQILVAMGQEAAVRKMTHFESFADSVLTLQRRIPTQERQP